MEEYSIDEARKMIAQAMKDKVTAYTAELVALRARELRKSEQELCITCGNADTRETCTCLRKSAPAVKSGMDACADCKAVSKSLCKCMAKDEAPLMDKAETSPSQDAKGLINTKTTGAVLPDTKDVKNIPMTANGGKPIAIAKGEPPMAKPPTKAPTASAPTAKVGSPGVGLAKASMIPGVKPRLGGHDAASQAMGQHAAMAAAPPPPAPAAKPGMAPVGVVTNSVQAAKTNKPDNQARIAEYQAFTPPPTVGHKAVGKISAISKAPMGTAATPAPGLLDRFTNALKGNAAK